MWRQEYGEALTAVVQREPGRTLDPAAIRAHLAGRIADYKVPRTIGFRSELPREETGKTFKQQLRDPCWTGHARTI